MVSINAGAFGNNFGINQTPSAYVNNVGLGQTSPTASNTSQFINLSQTTTAQTLGSTQTGLPANSTNTGLPSTTPAVGSTTPAPAATDTRIRLGPLNPSVVYGNISNSNNSSIIATLAATNGIIFPYTPSITFTQGVDYMTLQLVHSNTDYAAYTRTPSVKLSVSGKFTVQNAQEGIYALAVIHFLRAVSKSYFGTNDVNAGMPPPVLVFSGYGTYMFGNSGSGGLRVILTNHSWSFDDTVDYIPITIGGASGGGTAKLPALFTISLDLTVVQTPQRMMNIFNFNQFASGALMQGNNSGWI